MWGWLKNPPLPGAPDGANGESQPNLFLRGEAARQRGEGLDSDEHRQPAPSPQPSPQGERGVLRRHALVGLVGAFLVGAAAYGAYRKALADIGPLNLEAANAQSVTVLDRENRLLRAFTTPDGRWRLPVEPNDVDPNYVKLLLAFEDRRFYEHGGVDPRAIARAVVQAVTHGRLVSGGSTLTMQTARLLDGRHERTAFGKLRQMLRARQLERALPKTEILRLYLRLAPFGGNIEGVRAATLAYFGKEPRRLSLSEAALLVALPQSPEARRLDRHPKAAEKARNRVLDAAVEAGAISTGEAEKAKAERAPLARFEFPKLAPHLTESEVARDANRAVHKLTLDRNLQASLEDLAKRQAEIQGDGLSAAIVVADHQSGDILGYVGSAGYLDASRQGAVDMAAAVRSPGSTLKPFIYGLAFEAGFAHPETLIEDRPIRFGAYAPKNFDEDYHGTVSVREALAKSLNIPAVRALARVGPGKLAGRFRKAGVTARFPEQSQPTLAMALGGTGLTLLDLTQLYAALARGGDATMLEHRIGAGVTERDVPSHVNARRMMSSTASWYVSDILKDAPPPANAKGGRFAYKTGTSYGYRDAWAIGYDGRHVVAVWVGRPDGASVAGMMGRTHAAPILFDAFARVSEKRVALPGAPAGALLSGAADLPQPLKRWREPGEEVAAGPFLAPPVLISFPPDTAEIDAADFGGEPIVLKADGGALPLTWLVDGAPIASDPHARQAEWTPAAAGFAKLTVIDANGKTDRVAIRLK